MGARPTRYPNCRVRHPLDTTGSGDAHLDRQWQAGGRWILDEHGNVHRVIRGRNTANELVVELFEPVPAVRRTASTRRPSGMTIQTSLGLAIPQDPARPAMPTAVPESIGLLNPSDEQSHWPTRWIAFGLSR